jgi:aminoglycoside 2''-phosphotransferase
VLRVVDDGFDFKVLLLDDTWIVRIPRREQVLPALEREIELLPALAEALPVEVPRFDVVSREPPFVAYRFLSGTPYAGEDGEGVRAFLDALHAVDADLLPPVDWVERYRARCREFERLVLPLLDEDLRRRAEELFAEVETLTGFEPCVIHADLEPEHLLVSEGRLGAVIDWGDATRGDPALDYATFLARWFPDWEVDDELRRRARFYHRLGPFYSAHYGVFRGLPNYTERALDRLSSRL